jgi:hypothetical protein
VTDQPVEITSSHGFSLGDARIKIFQNIPGDRTLGGGTGEDDDVSMGMGIDAQPVLDQGEVAIVLTEQLGQNPVVLERYDDAGRLRVWFLLTA